MNRTYVAVIWICWLGASTGGTVSASTRAGLRRLDRREAPRSNTCYSEFRLQLANLGAQGG